MLPVIPVVLAVDVEPDGRGSPPGAGVEVAGLVRTVEALQALRPRLEDATGRPVRFAWFVRMDLQIAAQGGRPDALLERAPAALLAIEAASDVIGLHTHAGRWNDADRRWIADHGDPAWIDECLVSSTSAFERRFGRPCREHRFGDRFSSPAMFDRLAALGVRVDLTPEPGQPGVRRANSETAATGRIPDYASEPRTAHRHSDGPLWILPLSSADPAPALRPPLRWLRTAGYARRPRHRTLLLDRAWPAPGMPWDLAEGQLESGAAHLAFAIRSDLILGPRWAGASAVLEALLRRPLVRSLAFVGGEEAVERASGRSPARPNRVAIG